MELPVTPKPMPASSPDLSTNHTIKLFGIVNITLTGVVDIIVLAASLWSWMGKSASYLLKLAPFLWWALPAKTPAQVTHGNGGPAAQDWVPDILGGTKRPALASLLGLALQQVKQFLVQQAT
ncbi:hypothetical protein DSO57_1014700 [Entomophthora muscae]|uniref:Uncharacterized protein n=1 Tax=Entomophthora muscae TaxID=34485 RepID=A0ACC2T5T6_9FUNG|nr:hypothetical protein DSO57_1014700 [Entomophthora muscae]